MDPLPLKLLSLTPEAFRDRLQAAAPALDQEKILDALDFATVAHKKQTRVSGEPYITHPVGVASILLDLGMDTACICSGLLHDVLEDTPVTRDELNQKFGKLITSIVDGVTKLSKLKFDSREEAQNESLRKMLLAMSNDVRVIIVKLADRLHNLQTLKHLPAQKQYRKAQETMEIYTPLAHRLGMYKIKWAMEDLCLRYMNPEVYKDLVSRVRQKRQAREAFVVELIAHVEKAMASAGIEARVAGRPKSFYSIYKKTLKRSRDLSEIYDLIGLRIVTPSIKDCYAALGVIHETWTPLPNRFKDYIAVPKPNLYQSLHTTVIHPAGQVFEVQIRTEEMDSIAEEGIAAHWTYKEDGNLRNPQEIQKKVAWLRQIIDLYQEASDTGEFLENVKLDLFQNHVYVFTPEGQVVELPAGATPLDFAYAIHTEVGHQCIGAQVNGKMVPLNYNLRNGQIIHILTNKSSKGPSRDWLDIVKSRSARSKIRSALKKENSEELQARGRELLLDEYKKRLRDREDGSLPRPAVLLKTPELEAAYWKLGLKDTDNLLMSIGRGDITPVSFVNSLAWFQKSVEEIGEEKAREALAAAAASQPRAHQAHKGVLVAGSPDMMVRLSKCCNPVIGDPIVGYITRGRGVSVHRGDCPNLQDLKGDRDRQIQVSWDGSRQHQRDTTYLVEIEVRCHNKPNVLLQVTNVISQFKLNIHQANARVNRNHIGILNYTIEIKDPSHLENLLDAIRRLREVLDVYRVQPGRGAEGSRAGA